MGYNVSFPFNTDKRLFFCGISGASMLSLALLCSEAGFFVGGSDTNPSNSAQKICTSKRIPLFKDHNGANVSGYDVFIYSAAIKYANPEFQKARELGLMMMSRAELLGAVTGGFENSVAVCGTHGKSTVTAMIYSIFSHAGKKPYMLCGATPQNSGRALEIGSESNIIYEACEYERSFLKFNPKTAVVLNIEREHTDTYPTLSDAENAFFEFARRSSLAVLSYDDPVCKRLESRLAECGIRCVNFSLDRTRSTLFAENLTEKRGFFEFDAIYLKKNIGHVRLRVPGEHNVKNALAAILTALELGIDKEDVIGGVENYHGLKRRFEYIGSYNGADIYDDYAHHPTEIRATLSCAKKMGYGRVICVFQAHTYSRTHDLFDEFITAFENCDEVIFAKIYAAREENVYGISPKDLAGAVKSGKYMESYLDIVSYLMRQADPKTLILTMGAGEMDKIAHALASENKVNF